MEEIKRERIITEVIGYEAFDGKRFDNKEECEKYEKSAYGVRYKELKSLMIGGDVFNECSIYESFGYGSEEFELAVLDIKNQDDLGTANKYFELVSNGNAQLIDKKYIGKRVLVNVGYLHDRDVNPYPKTEEELIQNFKNDIGRFYRPEDYKKEEK